MPNFFGVPVSRIAVLKKRKLRRQTETVEAPVNTELPVITGTLIPGETLTVSDGTWLNDPTSFAYQWYLDDVEIDGETANTYTAQVGDGSGVITAAVTASNAGGGATATSAGVTIIENTVLPSATPNPPVIGTAMTYTPGTWSSGTPTFTRWESSADGSVWATAAAMPNADSAPTDAEFGLLLRPVEANSGVEAASAATGAVAETLTGAQSSGANIVTNGDFASGLTGWTTFGTPTTVEVTGGRLHIITDATNEGVRRTVASATGTFYQMSIDTQVDADGIEFVGAVIGSLSSLSNTGTRNMVGIKRATDTSGFATIRGRTASSNIYADNAAIVPLTLNSQLTAPSADMDMAVLYPLPGSPRVGEQVRLLCRISDFATGDYWTAVLEWTGLAWNAVLYSVAANSLTARITAAGVGATDGIRITATGDDWELFTTADGGDNWTSRGTFTSTLYNTATGVNAMWTDQFVPELLTPNP